MSVMAHSSSDRASTIDMGTHVIGKRFAFGRAGKGTNWDRRGSHTADPAQDKFLGNLDVGEGRVADLRCDVGNRPLKRSLFQRDMPGPMKNSSESWAVRLSLYCR